MERWNKSKGKKDEDFQEEEIWSNWAAGKEKQSSNQKPKKTHNSSCSRIPNLSKKYSSKANYGESSSAPMSIHYNMGSFEENNNNDSFAAAANDDDDYEDDEMVPPHEIVAKRVARSPIVSYSMCEGVGRTLKGRDLSKLRNSILTRTGFLE